MTKSERWILSEWTVARNRVLEHRDRLLAHRLKTPFAEVDLLFGAPDGVLLVIEVKSWSLDLWGSQVISKRQCQRLERARQYLEIKSARPTRLVLAVVSTDIQPKIQYFEGFHTQEY